MRTRIYLILLLFGFLLGCNANRDLSSRQNYMMPQKSDLPRNSKYKPQKATTTYKVTKKKLKKTKKVYGQ